MAKRDEQRMAKLIRKIGPKAAPKDVDRSRQYDSTLKIRSQEPDRDTLEFFKDMKRREF